MAEAEPMATTAGSAALDRILAEIGDLGLEKNLLALETHGRESIGASLSLASCLGHRDGVGQASTCLQRCH